MSLLLGPDELLHATLPREVFQAGLKRGVRVSAAQSVWGRRQRPQTRS
jgi:hypothetical protein